MTIVIIAAKRKEGNPSNRVPFLNSYRLPPHRKCVSGDLLPDGRWDSPSMGCGGVSVAVGIVGIYPLMSMNEQYTI